MQDPNLVSYIAGQLAQGTPEAAIRRSLLASGWQPQAIDQAFTEYYAQNAAPAAPQPYTAPTSGRGRSAKQLLIIATVAVMLLLIAAAGVVLLMRTSKPATSTHSNSDQSAAVGTNDSSQSALERNASNVARKADVLGIAGAAASFISNHSGSLPFITDAGSSPTELLLCGDQDCQDFPEKVSLSAYKAGDVVFQDYDADLKVTVAEMVYIVPGAGCKADESGISAEAGSSRSMAFLYATPNGSRLVQRCVSY